jgi:glycerol transport system ATP-binding protein
LSDTVLWQASGEARALPDGQYTVGVRPHHISPVPNGPGRAPIEGRVRITELSGSESVIHFAHGPGHAPAEVRWVSQSHGVHVLAIGEKATFHLDVARCMYFAADGTLAAS